MKYKIGKNAIPILTAAGLIFLVIIAALLSYGFKSTPDNDECLLCHGVLLTMKDMTPNVKGKKPKPGYNFVDEKKLAGSVHFKTGCVDCHADLAGKDLPHDEIKVGKASCSGAGKCHTEANRLYSEGLHGKAAIKKDPLAPLCQDCHGNHQITKNNDPQSVVSALKIPFLCGRCHREGSKVQLQRNIPQTHILENYTESIHGEGLMKKGLTVTATCASCHSSHLILPHTDSRSSISRSKIAGTCTKCHGKIEEVHQKVIDGKRWEKEAHILPSCVDCHQPHKARKVFYLQGMSNSECMKCHQNKMLVSSKTGISLYIDTNVVGHSMHKKINCTQCHSNLTPSTKRPCATITQQVNCASCHDKVGDEYNKSIHGKLLVRGDTMAPTCKECHGTHNILDRRDPKSPVFSQNIPGLCGKCHLEGKKAAVRIASEMKSHQIVDKYRESIHGKGLFKSGLTVTATCTGCHTAHRELPKTDPESSINPKNIPNTCGTCHYGINEIYKNSIHSKEFNTKTDKKLPGCNDCHLSHTIESTHQDSFRLHIMMSCGKCHQQISNTYFDTYHGKASRLGASRTAKCHDCHGSHDILPATNLNSHLSRNNVLTTCQKCHKGASKRFAGYFTHATHHDPDKYPWLYYTFWAMTTLLLTVFAFSWLHTLMWLPKALQIRRMHKTRVCENEEDKDILITRFKPLNRALHICMVISFLALAATGMILKFAYTGFSSWVVNVIGGVETAGLIHRSAALLLIFVFLVHVYDLIKRKKPEFGTWKNLVFGRDSMMFNMKDLIDLVSSVKWFLGIGRRPEYGRWTYWEKFDYFAVFWGVFIIGSTGMMLWFPGFFTKLLPGSLLNIATIVHSDEALLAAGFIFTVHFFNTHFRPEKFPMDTVVFTGYMTLEEFKFDRPVEYQNAVAEGTLEEMITLPASPFAMRALRVFGWSALTIGIAIVIWIIYSILFSYI
ncbi:MAG: doubled protein [Ignavibacteria bacterium]|nr:doubled protein [Ignavibacteria bacterium]